MDTDQNVTAMTEGTQALDPQVTASTEGTQPPTPATPSAPATPAKPALWKNVLVGALSGLAGSSGATTFGGGLAKGTGAELNREAQNKEDATQQQAQMTANQKAAADVAHTQAMTAQIQRATMNLPENHQQTVIEGRADQTEKLRSVGGMIPAGSPDTSPDHHVALQQVTALTKANPGKLYTAEPIKGPDGKIAFQAMQSTDAPLSEDVPLLDLNGKKIGIIPKGTPATQATKLQVGALTQGVADLGMKAKVAQQNADSNRVKANAAASKASGASNPAALTDDALGFKPKLPVTGATGYQKIAGSFKKNADDLAQTEQTYQQFSDIIKDIDSGKDMTGAQSVVGLFNAIGISAEPLKGKGFRINNLTVAEHAGARGIQQAIEQKFGKLKTGEIITPQQLKDYASIAEQVRANKYVATVNQAHNAGLNADAFLPTGNGQPIDVPTARIFLKLTGGDKAKAQAAAQKKGWTF